MKIKRTRRANVSIPCDALIKLPIGKFIGCQYSLVDSKSTATIIWTYTDDARCLRTGCFDFNGSFLGDLDNEE